MKNNTLVFPIIKKYDVFELKKAYAKNFSLGITVAVLIHNLFIGVYYIIQSTAITVESKTHHDIITLTDLTLMNFPVDPNIAASSSITSIKNVIPIPVPDDKVVDEKLIPAHNDLSRSLSQQRDVIRGNIKIISSDAEVETPNKDIPDMKEFTPYEKISIDAVLKSVFTPAIQHNAPVMVWITVPFKFRLNN